jgi:hypothetical protein
MRASSLASSPGRAPASLRLPSRRTIAACVVGLPVVSLLVLREPSYDPTAWLIWGRQLTDGTLSTLGGPSWKPLPVAFTTLFSLAGDTVAPLLWLLVARAGALLAVVAAFGLARRLSGGSAVSGLIAAAGLALASDFLFNAVRGDSEGLLVAAALAAVLAWLDGRRRLAFALGGVAALLRPEVWPLWGLCGLALVRHERRLPVLAAVAVSGLAVLTAWFVPEHIGSGDWFRAATRAQNPVPGSPGQSSFPFLMVFVNGAAMLSIPVYAGAVAAVLRARRSGDRAVLGLAVGATLVMLIVALLAENGFTGSLRYVTLPASALCVLAGVGLPPLAAELRQRAAWRPAVVVTVVSVVVALGVIGWGGYRLARDEERYGEQLPALIRRAGGAGAIRACAPVSASPFERQAVAWRLHLTQKAVTTRRQTGGTAVAFSYSRIGRLSPMPVRLREGIWVLRSSCG